MDPRQIVDFAQNDQAKELRDSLYSGIHDKVMQHLETKKQEIAQNLISPQQDTEQDAEVENT